MAGNAQVRGMRELAAKMKALPEKLREAAGRRSARKAMAIVRAAARNNLQRINDPASPEDIAKNVYIQQSRSQSKAIGGVVMRVGILGGARPDRNLKKEASPAAGHPGGDTRHWRWVELGTEKTAAQPFLRPALENNVEPVLGALATGLSSELDKLVKEL